VDKNIKTFQQEVSTDCTFVMNLCVEHSELILIMYNMLMLMNLHMAIPSTINWSLVHGILTKKKDKFKSDLSK